LHSIIVTLKPTVIKSRHMHCSCNFQLEANPVIRRILTFLIPLRIIRGHLPSTDLMQRFPILDELYAPFTAAIRTGDISAYDAALNKWERRLVELNLWLTLEKARELCLRGLFRRV
jgi:COP9 signalosome complex subunit 12